MMKKLIPVAAPAFLRRCAATAATLVLAGSALATPVITSFTGGVRSPLSAALPAPPVGNSPW